ncbi:MAG: Hsp33 family molecular chaperone HslO, partial [Spirochaetaceae bacterium]|nr:Hsp33 family molecular chaperone HslO [Spirochaetaceae bacterium]
SAFADLGLVLREERAARFSCACDRARFAAFLAASNLDFLEDLAARGPWPVEAHCHNCATTYAFGREEVEAMLARRREAAE